MILLSTAIIVLKATPILAMQPLFMLFSMRKTELEACGSMATDSTAPIKYGLKQLTSSLRSLRVKDGSGVLLRPQPAKAAKDTANSLTPAPQIMI